MRLATSVLIGGIGALALFGPALAAPSAPRPAAPTESVWKPADTPPGGVSWSVLESTTEITRTGKDGYLYSKPAFSPQVEALRGRTIKVSGYMMPLQNGAAQTHFVLLAYPPDCPFHLNPAPMQFIEVQTARPVKVTAGVTTVEGPLELLGQDEGGVFYRISNGRGL